MIKCNYCGQYFSQTIFPLHLNRCPKNTELQAELLRQQKIELASQKETEIKDTNAAPMEKAKMLREAKKEDKEEVTEINFETEVIAVDADDIENMTLEDLRLLAQTLGIQGFEKKPAKQLKNLIREFIKREE
jgi:hypothetical protein